jgi:hypothetical protein
MTKGTILHSLLLSVGDLWGEGGLKSVYDRLRPETMAAVRGGFSAFDWYPTRYVVDYGNAVFDGPAANDEAAYRRYVDRSIDLSFGRIRSSLLRFVTPRGLAQRAADLWRHDNSHGTLTVDAVEDGLGKLSLRGHPFVHKPLFRLGTAETMRHILALSRLRNVRETHAVAGEALVITLLWDV